MRLEPWVLLFLAERPMHGYELIERLAASDAAPGADPGHLYRTLRRFEDEGLVRSAWDTTKPAGAPRRIYHLTQDGEATLRVWAAHVEATRRGLDAFLARLKMFVSETGARGGDG
jgi:poly-beta-hydroxybutyrate-responsive repressor